MGENTIGTAVVGETYTTVCPKFIFFSLTPRVVTEARSAVVLGA